MVSQLYGKYNYNSLLITKYSKLFSTFILREKEEREAEQKLKAEEQRLEIERLEQEKKAAEKAAAAKKYVEKYKLVYRVLSSLLMYSPIALQCYLSSLLYSTWLLLVICGYIEQCYHLSCYHLSHLVYFMVTSCHLSFISSFYVAVCRTTAWQRYSVAIY